MSRQARKRRTRHNRGGGARVLRVGLIALFCGAVISALCVGAYVLAIASTVQKLAGRKAIVAGASSQVFASEGTRLGFIQSEVLRTPVATSQMPQDLRRATVAIEDQRFYENDGIDLTGIFRSAVKDVITGEALQGGSTITMQLVRNLYLGNDVKSIKQKIAEAKLALEYNKVHSKREILTQYLNTVPYTTVGGQTALGVQAASRVLFNRPVWQLDLQQSALLAGLPQAPSQYNPLLYPAVAKHRRNEVLSKMAELHYISDSTARATEAMGLQLQRGYYYSRRRENYFFEYVRQLLIERYGRSAVDRGGLKVYTTIDLHMQELAHKAIAEVLNEPGDPSSGIVTIDPHNGYIEAMAQSGNYSESQYNLAAEGHRQAGSTFKAIDLAEALSKGVDPNSTYYVSHTLTPGWLPGYPTYEVKTFENTSLNQSIDLVSATLASDNTVYAQLAADLGEQTITEMAHKMGVKIHLDSYPSEALGGLTIGVSPLEMADVYATLADGGYRNKPIAITKVVFPDGHVDSSWGRPHRKKVLSDGVTSEETKILEENVQAGTAVRSKISCPTAAKTGTTEELVDAWLDGYTPEYATSVWMGYPNSRVPMTDVHGEPQQGGALPAEIWHAYMEPVVNGRCVPFPEPTEPLVYKPFFGKFALAGQAAVRTAPAEGAGHAHKHAPGGAKHRAGHEPEEEPAATGTEPQGGGPGNGRGPNGTGPPGRPPGQGGNVPPGPGGGAAAPGH